MLSSFKIIRWNGLEKAKMTNGVAKNYTIRYGRKSRQDALKAS